jgi:hypothetical protein
VRQLFHDAWRVGLRAVAGRVKPALAGEFAEHGACVGRAGHSMRLHSPRVGLLHVIETGDACVSQLEGEWWLSF